MSYCGRHTGNMSILRAVSALLLYVPGGDTAMYNGLGKEEHLRE